MPINRKEGVRGHSGIVEPQQRRVSTHKKSARAFKQKGSGGVLGPP